jgi:hypothetical protein
MRPNWTDDELKDIGQGIKTVASVSGIDFKQKVGFLELWVISLVEFSSTYCARN